MPSTINSLLAEARAALISDPAAAAGMLEEVAERLRGQAPLLDADALRSELAALAKLARNGEQMWRAWGRLLGLEPGYTAAGVLRAEPGASHIVVEG
jgi:hypothetical protein